MHHSIPASQKRRGWVAWSSSCSWNARARKDRRDRPDRPVKRKRIELGNLPSTQPNRPDRPNEQDRLVDCSSILLGFPKPYLLGCHGCLIDLDIDRKEANLEHNKTHWSSDRNFTDRSSDHILCEGARGRVWWRILQRFKKQWRLREHGQPWITHL